MVPSPRRDPAATEGTAQVGLFNSRLEARVTERVVARQGHRLQQDFHADPALTFG